MEGLAKGDAGRKLVFDALKEMESEIVEDSSKMEYGKIDAPETQRYFSQMVNKMHTKLWTLLKLN